MKDDTRTMLGIVISSALAASLVMFAAGCEQDAGDHLEDAGESVGDAVDEAGDDLDDMD